MGHRAWTLGGVALLAVRYAVSLHGYSGFQKPPMHGDYEAQRHWMELTINLPVGEWYRGAAPGNDLQYWGLDYPPLTAYVSWCCGIVSRVLEPASMELGASRGYETESHKAFMRLSVLVIDVLVNFVATWHLARVLAPRSGVGGTWKAAGQISLLVLLQPALVLVDHGHFQYNSCSLGLAIGAAAAILQDREVLGSVLFCLSLNFKQMSLYYAPAFFFFLLSRCARRKHPVLHVAKLGVTVVLTFAALWWPFCVFAPGDSSCAESLLQVLRRLFPFGRGLFEDKVANFWYVSSILVDLRFLMDIGTLKLLSLSATLALLCPSALDIMLHPPTPRRFTLALYNSALAFFLCSFQVHEKSFLMPLTPIAFLVLDEPLLVGWLSIIAVFSMHPLLLRDGLRSAYVACVGLFLIVLVACGPLGSRWKKDSLSFMSSVPWALAAVSLLGMVVLHCLELFVTPPDRYPDLYPVLFSIYAFGHFVLAWVYGAYWQWYSDAVPTAPRATRVSHKGKSKAA